MQSIDLIYSGTSRPSPRTNSCYCSSMSGNSTVFDALNQILTTVLDEGPSVPTEQEGGDPLETQLKMLKLIVDHGTGLAYKTPGIDPLKWMNRCLLAIERIVSTSPLLLNRRSSPSGAPVFKWLLQSLIPLLSTTNETLVDTVRKTFISIIHAISFKLRLFSYKHDIREYFLALIDNYLENIFKSSTQESLLANLSVSANLFSVLTNSEIREQLLLDQSYDQKFESVSRKVDYAISGLIDTSDITRLDAIKSNMVINMLHYSVGGEFICFTRFRFLLENFSELLRSSYIKRLNSTQSSLAFALLFSFDKSIDSDNIDLFQNGLQLETIIVSLDMLEISPTLKKVLTFLQSASTHTPLAEPITPFQNNNLEEIRLRICNKLSFESPESLVLESLQYQLPNKPTTIQEWVKSIKNLKSMTDIETFLIVSSIGTLFCYLSDTLDRSGICSSCLMPTLSSAHIDQSRPNIEDDPIVEQLKDFLLARLSEVKKDDCVLNMCYLSTFHKLFTHYQPPKINSSDSVFSFIQRNFLSKARQLRLSSSIIFPLFVISKHYVQENNFSVIVKLLDNLDLKKKEYLAEGAILVWGELTITSEGERFRAMLNKLLDFLFSSDIFQSSMSFHELKIISSAKGITPFQLTDPSLADVATIMAQRLETNPSIAQKMSDLVELTPEFILNRTSNSTIPFLLTYYKHDILGKIAEISKVKKHVLIERNRGRINAVLIMTVPGITASHLRTIILNAAPELKDNSTQELLNVVDTCWEIFKFYSPEKNNQDEVLAGFMFTLKTWRPHLSSESLIPTYMASNILGTVQCFFHSVRDSQGKSYTSEKLKAVYAIEYLSTIAGTTIVSVLPQIYTCLVYALGTDQLKSAALHCWRVLVQNLEESHLGTILDESIAMIIQNWKSFDRKCKLEAKRLIGALFDKSESFRAKYILTFYSVAEIDDLAEIYSRVMSAIQKRKPALLFKDITRRCRSDNINVAKQSLVDLSRFISQYQRIFYSTILSKSAYKEDIQALLSSLFDILHKFKSDDDISIQCTKCIGMIGMLDPTKFELEKKNDQFIIASDFEDFRDRVAFMVRFLNQLLVPAFWSAHSPDQQLFLAFTMQEFLKLCDLNSIDPNNVDVSSTEGLVWGQFTELSKSTLTPFLSSRYTITSGDYSQLTYPIFSPSQGHTRWLRFFTLDMLKKASFGAIAPILNATSGLIKDQDATLCMFLLPYCALHIIVDGDDESRRLLKVEILNVLSYDTDNVHPMAVGNLRLAYESIFNLLDYFRKWIFARKQLLKRKNIKKTDPYIVRVNALLEEIPHELMAKRSYQSNSFERSTLYLEQSFRSSTDETSFSDSFTTLQSLYANIGDYDALDGALKKFSVKSLEDRITQLEYSDNWRMAQDCLQALGDVDSANKIEVDTDTKLLKSLFDHDLYDNVLEKLDLMTVDHTVPKDWLGLGLEASVLSGRLDHVQRWVSQLELQEGFASNQNLINYHIGRSLLSLKNSDTQGYEESVDNAFLMLGAGLGVNKNLSMNKIKPVLALLHSLTDIDLIHSNGNQFDSFQKLKTHLDDRLIRSGSDFNSSWIISSFRKTADSISGHEFNIMDSNETWLKLAQTARKHNRLDLATNALMHSISLDNADTDFEYAKLIWAQGDHSRALKFLEDLKIKASNSTLSPRERAKIQLKYTNWLDVSNNSNSTKVIEEYTAAMKIDGSWEKPYYYLGKYLNKLLDLKNIKVGKTNPKDIGGEYERRVVIFYTKAIYYGTKYLFEALPKLLTVWLDFSESIAEVPSDLSDAVKVSVLAERKKNLESIHSEIQRIGDKLPKYYWYTVFSQLLSRILHSNRVTGQIIMGLVNHVVQEYPSHALWSILAQYKSTQPERSKKGKRMIDLYVSSEHKNGVSNITILQSSKQLFNQLMAVCKKNIPTKLKSSLSLRNDFDFDFSSSPYPLVVPVKTNFQITLPSSVENVKNHNPFPNSSTVTIHKFIDKVDVLSSMQRPRRLYLVGSDGLSYSVLCKPNDDLRKDAKLMEFTTMVDHLLRKDYESEQRKLHITSYAVIPLNENYGIIEWVENTKTMRDILRTNYYNIGISLDIPKIRKILDMECDISEKAEMFTKEIVSKYPPVLYQWFIENFPDPASWYTARNNYTRTTAVMSMVGYMLGLGDRHGENLLFKQDGGLFHVDFDCLFEKGLELTIPERVPFRLTHNMVDAFGITGVEGTFKKSCEVTLQLIRNNETILMNILESFLHDPIMDWAHKRKAKNTPQSALSTIRRKIRGVLDQEGLAMGVQGQVEFLIQQATSVDNLCQMYIGWMAFW